MPEPAMYCRACSYPLTGLSRHACPECGREFDPAKPETFARSPGSVRLRRWCKRIAIAVALFPIFYVCAYVTSVRHGTLNVSGSPPWSIPAGYVIGGDLSAWFFAPANRVDRKLRPDYWLYWGGVSEKYAETYKWAYHVTTDTERALQDPEMLADYWAVVRAIDDLQYNLTDSPIHEKELKLEEAKENLRKHAKEKGIDPGTHR